MEPKFVARGPIRLAGVAAKGDPKDVDFSANWNVAFVKVHQALMKISVDGGRYGAWFHEPDGGLVFIAGVAVDENAELPAGVEVRTIPAATYAVFTCGIERVLDTVKMAIDQWLPASTQYRRDETATDFEFLPKAAADGSFKPAVFIPVLEN